MGFFEDLEKALNNFTNWLGDWDYEEPEEEYEPNWDWDYLASDPEYELVEDSYYAPVADFFENLDKGTDEIVTDFVGELLGKKDTYEKPETWYAYYWTLEGGYVGREVLSDDSGVYYADSDDREWDVFDRIVDDVGARYSGGQGLEVEPSVDSPYEVDKEDVDEWEKLD